MEIPNLLKGKLTDEMFLRLMELKNESVLDFLSWVVGHCDPESVYVLKGTREDQEYVKRRALETGEEIPLRVPGHTIHFDKPSDQARAREDTFILSEPIPFVNTKPRQEGLNEVMELLRGSMRGREMFVGFYALGPKSSPFQILAIQVTDSPYVIHSENILYRSAYDEFVKVGGNVEFLRFVHSKGTGDVKKRRIVIDFGGTVYSVNTTYAGNSVGLKKLALRLTLRRAVNEGWLSEHMAIVGLEGKETTHYVTAAFPSGSGKTSTSMMGKLVSDDLAFIRESQGIARAVNPEIGVFGIIQGINKRDDPIIWEVLHTPGEVIFSNVLMTESGEVYWVGSEEPVPRKGINYAGEWWPGKTNSEGVEIPPSHPNARFTAPLKSFRNADPRIDDPRGVEIEAMIFGVRDYTTVVPIAEAFSWAHGVVTMGASMESARTSAVVGKLDEMEFNPMALLDFISVSLGEYLRNYLEFGKKLRLQPRIYGANYFLKDMEGRYLNSKEDKRVWLRWITERLEGRADHLRTAVGLIPTYEDLRRLFKEVLNKEYMKQQYELQFSIRLKEYKNKYLRIRELYSRVKDTPREVLEILDEQIGRIDKDIQRYGDTFSPFNI
ncbi:phosphoenolpyruvate carboxykinase (GTP) [Metallosphaera yellowstonensis MK1]|uniref:Phosphoenolpyruvate carboxykinase [GTP] n=1 Tax=Metallosphaera yellowstonensis MK1 TaxID=671065 RepID=H2C7H9_9CREN|nr:phosphoenolpyruvate carboxykinase (GTP) [Metallosphaera yellowstonensis]EHP68105.1 phosphoenolpyruvate carboxykinase (GTP) [Metallosphaera yellowstonensis MK1]